MAVCDVAWLHVDNQEVEFSRSYLVLHVKTLTKSQSVLSRWKQASRYIFATQTDVKSKLTINFRVAEFPGPLLNTWTSIFDIFCLLASLFICSMLQIQWNFNYERWHFPQFFWQRICYEASNFKFACTVVFSICSTICNLHVLYLICR